MTATHRCRASTIAWTSTWTSTWMVPSRAIPLRAATAGRTCAVLAPWCRREGTAFSVRQTDGTRGAGGELGQNDGSWVHFGLHIGVWVLFKFGYKISPVFIDVQRGVSERPITEEHQVYLDGTRAWTEHVVMLHHTVHCTTIPLSIGVQTTQLLCPSDLLPMPFRFLCPGSTH